MAITTSWFGQGLQYLLDNPLDLEQSTVKLALVTASYTPNRDTNDFFDDVSASELGSGNGYTTGGVTLTNVAWSYDASSDQVRLDFDDPSWAFTGTKTWRYGVIYVDTAGASSTDPVIGLIDWGANRTIYGITYTLAVDSAGALYIDTT